MKFAYILETVNKNGIAERSVKEFNKDSILLGRGTSADVLLMNRQISLSHAKLSLVDDGLVIEDLESLSGVLVNGTLIKRQRLALGDKVKLGTFVFEVVTENEHWAFLEHRKVTVQVQDLDTLLDEQYRKLRFQTYLPSFTLLSSVLGGLVLVFFLILPWAGKNKLSWNPGPISNAHRMLENQCESCHASAFVPVRDAECSACHTMSDHAKNLPAIFEKHANLNLRCASCHMEHNGTAGITASESKLCANCHGDIANLLPGTQSPLIPTFPKHPQFRVTISEPLKEIPAPMLNVSDAAAVQNINARDNRVTKRVSLEDKANLQDLTQLKLNHKIHLQKDLNGPTGPVTLECSACHGVSRDTGKIVPIQFETHCASCHGLEFDDKLPGKSVPHGNPDTVFNFLYAEYAKLFLIKDGVEDPNAQALRRKPGQELNRGEEVEFSRQSVEAQSRSVEESLFNRTACHLCHMVDELGAGEMGIEKPGQAQRISKYRVIPPQIPDRWMPASTFTHSAHQEVSCESCHTDVRQSEKTTDVLLPGMENCVQCHEGGRGHRHSKGKGMVISECIMCHSYHDQLPLKEETKRSIQQILLSQDSARQIDPILNVMAFAQQFTATTGVTASTGTPSAISVLNEKGALNE